MRGVHAGRSPGGTTIRRVAREVGLLALVAVVTGVTLRDTLLSGWIPVGVGGGARWAWAPVAGAVLAVLARLWRPAVGVVAAAALFGWWQASGVALAVTAYAAARAPSAGRRVVVLGVAGVTGLGVGVLSTRQPARVLIQLYLVVALVCLILPAYLPVMLGKAARVRRALRERTRYLEENGRLVRTAARLAERSRMAQEMHDQFGHRLSLIVLYAGALELAAAGGDSTGGAEAKLIRGTAQAAMHELRTILGVLRCGDGGGGAPLQPVAETGSRSDIARLVSQSQAVGVNVRLHWRGADLKDAPSLVRSAVHRVVREGLTNVHRHAAGAAATVVVERESDTVRVRVANAAALAPSAGAFPPGSGLGLAGVRERAMLLGGVFCAGRMPDGGFQVTVGLPLSVPAGAGRTPGWGAVPGGAGGDPPTAALRTAGGQASSVDRWRRYGSSMVLAGGLVGIAALVLVALAYVPVYGFGRDDGRTPVLADIRIGMTHEETLAVIGRDDPVARLAARSVESRWPSGSACLYEQDWSGDQPAAVLRYCFQADRLVSLDRFELTAEVLTAEPGTAEAGTGR